MQTATTTSGSSRQVKSPKNRTKCGEAYRGSIERSFLLATNENAVLFTTDAEGLFDEFLKTLGPRHGPAHNCHACREFVRKYGGLVTIDADGRTTPVMWTESGGYYADAYKRLARLVAAAKVTGVFLTNEKVWGTPSTGDWRHMSVVPRPSLVLRSTGLKNAGQVMADKKEEFAMLHRGLADFSKETIQSAFALLQSGTMYRSEHALAPAQWFLELKTKLEKAPSKALRDNIVWNAVAIAPVGFCHVRSTMIGTLLEDIQNGVSMEEVKRKFAEKMDPLQYRRPTAAPTAGNIMQAEKVIAELGLERSLKRRMATLDDVQKLWVPCVRPTVPDGGVFSHLKNRTDRSEDIIGATMTWLKFMEKVLPGAVSMELHIKHRMSFAALVTAEDPDSPPILQWDSAERRNPVSWYLYPGGSSASQWGLHECSWVKVTALSYSPNMWNDAYHYSNHGKGVMFILEGCRDSRNSGSALFPEILKSDLHQVRRTIEAHSRASDISGRENASASGVLMQEGVRAGWGCRLRVTSVSGTITIYTLDRWD